MFIFFKYVIDDMFLLNLICLFIEIVWDIFML